MACQSVSGTRRVCSAAARICWAAICRGSGVAVTGSTHPWDQQWSIPSASSVEASLRQRKRQFPVVPARRPVRPRRCRKDDTVRGALIWITRSRSPTSMPSSSVDVATMTQSRAPAKASSDSRRSAADREEWEMNVVTPRCRS